MAVWRKTYQALDSADEYLTRIFDYVTWRDLWLLLLTVAFVVFLAGVTPFAHVLREDAYNFTVKGMEISLGDFSLDRPQAIGWPLLLGLVFSIMSVDNVFEAMYVSRWTSILCTALGVFALGKACSAMLADRSQKGIAVMIVLAYMTNALIYTMARSAMSEALFVLLVIGVVYFSIRATEADALDIRSLVTAASLAAASYYVRPNGLFVFAALVLTIVLHSWGSRKSTIVAVVVSSAVFVIAISPYLYARFAAFGSPFDYGPNSKYFVDHYEHVWADNIAAPSLWKFLSTHSIAELYDRFVDGGLLSVLKHTERWLLNAPGAVIALLGGVTVFLFRKRRAYIVPLVLVVSIAGISMIYEIFGTVRHLYYLLPLLLLCAGAAFFVLERYRVPVQSIAATAIILLIVSDLPLVVWMGPEQRQIPQVKDHWAVWASNNIEGTVAIVEGGDFLKMSQHYEPIGWRVARSFRGVVPHIRVWRPGVYDTLDEAMIHFKKINVRYLITDREGLKRRPYLRDVTDPRWQDQFKHLGYFPIGDKGARLSHVNIYEIIY
jgi:hypothetical protein